jgi:NADH-quinone oxidoreductase subunit H
VNPAFFEIGKFARLTAFWLSIIFGAVWIACWLVGVLVPSILLNGTPSETAKFIAQVCQSIVPLVAVAVFIPINAMYMVLCERRALALVTVRKGPNRVGILGFKLDGLFQTAADAVKLLLKEDITPQGADAIMFTLAPIIFFAPSIIGVLPLLTAASGNHPLFGIANLPTGIFYVLAVSSIPVVGIVMGGWASNNKYSLVGGLRSAAQAISYEIPLVLSLITVCMMAGSLDLVKIADQQKENFLHWNIFGGGALAHLFVSPPASLVAGLLMPICGILLFLLYITGACAEVNRIPFDLPEAESELVSGYNTEYSGIKFAIFFLAEFTNLFVVCSIAAVMFLGGGHAPFASWEQAVISGLQSLINSIPGGSQIFSPGWIVQSLIDPATVSQAFWIILKTYTLVLFAILVRATLPRFRIDQLMDFGWKRLIPLSLVLLVAVTFLRELV